MSANERQRARFNRLKWLLSLFESKRKRRHLELANWAAWRPRCLSA